MTYASGAGAAVIRKAVPEDLQCICRIERNPGFRTFVGTWPEDEHRQTLADPDAAYWVVEDPAGEVTGFCILRGLQGPHRSVEIKRIVSSVPNQGVGRQLLSFVLEQAFTTYGAHRVWLDVFVDNARARHVYRTIGFQEEGVLREAILRDGQYHSLVLMSLLDYEYRQRKESRIERK
jgi:diamine N-acetyltransferase